MGEGEDCYPTLRIISISQPSSSYGQGLPTVSLWEPLIQGEGTQASWKEREEEWGGI